jgi:hypothetical protein
MKRSIRIGRVIEDAHGVAGVRRVASEIRVESEES